jgi:hypothetical protein
MPEQHTDKRLSLPRDAETGDEEMIRGGEDTSDLAEDDVDEFDGTEEDLDDEEDEEENI